MKMIREPFEPKQRDKVSLCAGLEAHAGASLSPVG
jgi:hypothetical protein